MEWRTMADCGRQKRADEFLLLAVAAGPTLRGAAPGAGISERTATRRIADPNFRRRITELRAEMVNRALGCMADSMTDAADTLRRLLKAPADNVKLGAARSLLELGAKLRDSVEVEDR